MGEKSFEKLPELKIGNVTLEVPIFNGGMGIKLTGSELAAAVSNEGGAGVLTGVGLGIDQFIVKGSDYLERNKIVLAATIKDALEKSKNSNIFVNIMVAVSDFEDLVRTSVKNGARGIITGAGLPTKLPEFVNNDTEIIPIVSSARVAKVLITQWKTDYNRLPSAIIYENPNYAGGHLGTKKDKQKNEPIPFGNEAYNMECALFEMAELLRTHPKLADDERDIPIIFAGGVWDRNDVDRVIDLGKKFGIRTGVQVGTRFLTTKELNASDDFKKRLLEINEEDIIIDKSPLGMMASIAMNDFYRNYKEKNRVPNFGSCVNCIKGCLYREKKFGYCIIRALDHVRSNPEEGLLFTGANGFRLKEQGLTTTHDVMDSLKGMPNEKNVA